MKLSEIQMFTFCDWSEITPEDRAQRTLNTSRIPDITRYILENEDGYLFSSITASYKGKEHFEPMGSDGLGYLEIEFNGDNFVINDGQHRCAAIKDAIKENPGLREESISVLLFPYQSRERVQQMFADLNRFVVKANNATGILTDHRDVFARVIKAVCDQVPAFQGLVDKEHQSLPSRSEKVFTLYSLYDATKDLLADSETNGSAGFDELVAVAVEYWTTVSTFMPDWAKVRNDRLRPSELRQETISTHSVVLRAIGGVGAELMRRHPSDWKDRLAGLLQVNWSKRNHDWENVCMVANSVVANRQARVATKAYLKRKLGLPVSETEQKSIEPLRAQEEPAAVPADASSPGNGHVQTNGNISSTQSRRPLIRPTEVRIGTETLCINMANQIPVVVANWILKQEKTLPEIQNFVHKTNVGFHRSAQTKRLGNGWFIEVGDSQEMLIRKGRRLLDACGLRHLPLEVVLEDRTIKTT